MFEILVGLVIHGRNLLGRKSINEVKIRYMGGTV